MFNKKNGFLTIAKKKNTQKITTQVKKKQKIVLT